MSVPVTPLRKKPEHTLDSKSATTCQPTVDPGKTAKRSMEM